MDAEKMGRAIDRRELLAAIAKWMDDDNGTIEMTRRGWTVPGLVWLALCINSAVAMGLNEQSPQFTIALRKALEDANEVLRAVHGIVEEE